MARWTIDSPATVELGDFAALRVRLVSGSVAILAAQGRPAIDVSALSGQPLLVTNDAGILTVGYEDMRWDGLLGLLRPQQRSADITLTVPPECPVQLAVVNASTTVSGVSAGISATSVSGDLTLDAVNGTVNAKSVSGDLEASDLVGGLSFNSVNGDLTLAGGLLSQLDAKTVSGRVTADIGLPDGSGARIATVSGEVVLRLPADQGARVELRSASGRVRSAFDGVFDGGGYGPANASGSIGDGAASLSVTSMSGDLTLLARAQTAAAGVATQGGAR
ncbi:MAG TPA: DUF4097 family beta strand repeat-containing protein [Streptosporangiaceae bacterium]|jgi:hypothetical protein